MTHGQAIYSHYRHRRHRSRRAAGGGHRHLRREAPLRVGRRAIPMEGSGGWTIASVHLAAFDPDAAVRTRQLRELLAWAEREYQSGQHVVHRRRLEFPARRNEFPEHHRRALPVLALPVPAGRAARRLAHRRRRAPCPACAPTIRPMSPGENYTHHDRRLHRFAECRDRKRARRRSRFRTHRSPARARACGRCASAA